MTEARRRRILRWLIWSVVSSAVTFVVVGAVMLKRAGPILKGRIVETLSAKFESRVELDDFQVSILRGLEASGRGLRIFPTDKVMAAGAKQPLIALKEFQFHSGFIGLFFKPTHVRAVHVRGLSIHIPPREMRRQATPKRAQPGGKIKVVVDEIICEQSQLVIDTAKPDKDPKNFQLKRIALYNVGPNARWRYDALLTNAVPPGDIHSAGTFGPWNLEAPGDSKVTGHYTFDNANLNAISGIGGMLSSKGSFDGRLNRIVVEGTTNTPDFTLDTGDNPVPLRTLFSAVVDGTTGDTYLQPVKATLGKSTFTTSGAVINIKGVGHRIELDVDIPGGRIEDFLNLAVKTQPPIMNGQLRMRTKLQIRPGKERVVQKLTFQGTFGLKNIRFLNPRVQDKVDMLSLRARGRPRQAKPGATDVNSEMGGDFALRDGRLVFQRLSYQLPGATVRLQGVYSLDGKQFDFRGKVRTEASLAQMVASRWRSALLRIVPLFHKKGGGAEIPVKVSGTKSEPKFGLDLFGKR